MPLKCILLTHTHVLYACQSQMHVMTGEDDRKTMSHLLSHIPYRMLISIIIIHMKSGCVRVIVHCSLMPLLHSFDLPLYYHIKVLLCVECRMQSFAVVETIH